MIETKEQIELTKGITYSINAAREVKRTISRFGTEHIKTLRAFSLMFQINQDIALFYAELVRKGANVRFTSKEFRKLLKEKAGNETINQAAQRLGLGNIVLYENQPVKKNINRSICKLDDGRTFSTAREAVSVLIREGKVKKPPYKSFSAYSLMDQNKIKYERVSP